MVELLKSLGVKIIPLLSVVALACGGRLTWYAQLSPEDRAKADAIAEGYAMELYNKARSQLSASEASHVEALTQRHFAN